MPRSAALAAVAALLLLVPAAAAQSDPNPRSPDLGTRGDVNRLAVATTSGWVGAATQDVGSTGLMQDPAEPVWYLWDGAGQVRQTGPADHPDCASTVQRPTDLCQTHAVGVAMSATGHRMVVASATSPTAGDDTRTLLFRVAEATGFVGQHVSLPGEFVAMAMSASGQTFAVLTNDVTTGGIPPVTQRTAHAYLYAWGAGGAVTQVWDVVAPTGEVGRAIALSPDGTRVAIGVGPELYWLTSTAGTPAIDDNPKQGDVRTVAVSAAAGHWAVAGFASGQLALYSDAHTTAPAHLFATGSPQATRVAITPDGRYAVAGFSDGQVRYYCIDAACPEASVDRLTRIDTMAAGSASVSGLAISADGRFVAVSSGANVSLYHATPDGLTRMWQTALAGTVRALAMDGAGDAVAAAAGDRVTVFQAKREVTGTPTVGEQQIAPGASRNNTVALTNTGNRPVAADITMDFPAGWFAAVAPAAFDLEPGASQPVSVQVIVPQGTPPGMHEVALEWALAGGAAGRTSYQVEVPEVRSPLLQWPGGPGIPVRPGEVTPFAFTVLNNGNVRDEVVLWAVAQSSGWMAQVSPDRFVLDPGESRAVSLHITAPAGAGSGQSSVVTVTPDGFPQRVLTLTAAVGASFGPQFAGPQGVIIQPGEQRNLDLTVRNTGNVPDAFDLRITTVLPAGWTATFLNGQPQMRTDAVPAGGEKNVTLVLEAPPDAEPGNVVLPVRATSLGDPTRSVVVSLVLSVEGEGPAAPGGGRGTPGAGIVVLLGALGGLVALRRRRDPGAFAGDPQDPGASAGGPSDPGPFAGDP